VYGVISYLVTQSTHDIGVRVALGAQPGHILGLVVRQGMALAAVGIVAGLIGAAALTRVMASLLFGVSATDALTFGLVAAILAAVVCAATVIPARRATGVDPMVALARGVGGTSRPVVLPSPKGGFLCAALRPGRLPGFFLWRF
jgi:putative ABC transport system permease protein